MRRNEHGGLFIRQSDLGSYQRCAQQKKLRDGAKEGRVPEDNLSATVYGTVMHHAVQVMETLHHQGREDALDVALATFAHYWMPENIGELEPGGITIWIPRQTYGGLRERGFRNLRDYYDILKGDDATLLALEYQFAVPYVIYGVEHTLTGTIDRLAVRHYKAYPYISVEDFKTGKQPTYLRFHHQWTVYSYATTRPEFWENFPPETVQAIMAMLARKRKKSKLFDDGLDGGSGWVTADVPLLARRGRWINLKENSITDAGWRGEQDYARLHVALREYVKAVEADVYPLTLSGETCLYCPFAYNGACGGVPVPSEDEGRPA